MGRPMLVPPRAGRVRPNREAYTPSDFCGRDERDCAGRALLCCSPRGRLHACMLAYMLACLAAWGNILKYAVMP